MKTNPPPSVSPNMILFLGFIYGMLDVLSIISSIKKDWSLVSIFFNVAFSLFALTGILVGMTGKTKRYSRGAFLFFLLFLPGLFVSFFVEGMLGNFLTESFFVLSLAGSTILILEKWRPEVLQNQKGVRPSTQKRIIMSIKKLALKWFSISRIGIGYLILASLIFVITWIFESYDKTAFFLFFNYSFFGLVGLLTPLINKERSKSEKPEKYEIIKVILFFIFMPYSLVSFCIFKTPYEVSLGPSKLDFLFLTLSLIGEIAIFLKNK